jgi:hypothetical protein
MTRSCEEPGLHEILQRFRAALFVEAPQSLCLLRGQAQSGHLEVLIANPTKDVLGWRRVKNVHRPPPMLARAVPGRSRTSYHADREFGAMSNDDARGVPLTLTTAGVARSGIDRARIRSGSA